MNPILKVLIVTSMVCFGLYFVVAEFLGKTKELNASLDVKSLAYIRDEVPDEKSRPDTNLDSLPDQRNPGKQALEREQGVRIDATKVKASSGEIEKEPDVESDDTSNTNADLSDSPRGREDRLKQVLGISVPSPPVRAVDVALEIPSECDVSDIMLAPLSVEYRHESPTIKDSSLSGLELLVAEYRKCDSGIFHLSHNPLGREDSTPALMQRRLDELKYFFLQHRVPKVALRFPEIHD